MSREQQILRAAEQLFHERSFDGVGVDAIGRAAGISGAGVYRHFGSKADILAALIDQAADTLLAELPEPDPDEWLELQQLITAHVEFAVNHQALADIWQREHRVLEATRRRSFERRQRRYVDRWVACLERCCPGRARDELLAAIRALHSLITSDVTRRAGAQRYEGLSELLGEMALAAVRGLASA